MSHKLFSRIKKKQIFIELSAACLTLFGKATRVATQFRKCLYVHSSFPKCRADKVKTLKLAQTVV